MTDEPRDPMARLTPIGGGVECLWQLSAALVIMLVAFPAAAQDGFEGGRPIGDWSVYCWTSGDCSAELFQSDGGSSSNMLTIIRGLEDAGPTIGLMTSMARAQWSAGISFIVDEKMIGRFDENSLCVRDYPPGAFSYAHHLYLTGAQARKVFSTFWADGTVQVRFEGADGAVDIVTFTNDGAMPLALGWIERRQGRLNEPWRPSMGPETIMMSDVIGALVPSDC